MTNVFDSDKNNDGYDPGKQDRRQYSGENEGFFPDAAKVFAFDDDPDLIHVNIFKELSFEIDVQQECPLPIE